MSRPPLTQPSRASARENPCRHSRVLCGRRGDRRRYRRTGHCTVTGAECAHHRNAHHRLDAAAGDSAVARTDPELLQRTPDYGPVDAALADPSRRASCLSGLGYPASTQILGAQPIGINARPGLLLVVPGDGPDTVAVYAVALNCSAADTGLLASTTAARATGS